MLRVKKTKTIINYLLNILKTMKQIKTLLIAAMLVLGANQTINAQTKTAHVDVSEIMTKMPAMLDAQKQLDKLSTTYDGEYKKMVEEYQGKLKKIRSRSCYCY